MKKVMVVIGARPDAIKMAPVIKEIQRTNFFELVVVSSGQHREQLRMSLKPFGIVPDYDLSIMKEQQTLTHILCRVIEGLEPILIKEKPDILLLHGDTQTCIGAALCAFYNKIPVAHVESGLRSFDNTNPWPEEMNRVATDFLSTLYFAPTVFNRKNLLSTGVAASQIYVTGQTQIDASNALYNPEFQFRTKKLKTLDFSSKRVILVTAHRRENYGLPMESMFRAIRKVADSYDDVQVVYPVHLSPYVTKTANAMLSGHERILLLPPLDYLEMVNVMARCYMVMSDSGGIQEEAPVFHKPLVLMRQTTERQEGIEVGTALLSGTETSGIYRDACSLLDDESMYRRMSQVKNPFGDGKASERIVEALRYFFGLRVDRPQEFRP